MEIKVRKLLITSFSMMSAWTGFFTAYKTICLICDAKAEGGLEVKQLTGSRSGILILFVDQMLMSCVHWLHELLVLRKREDLRITRATMYQYLLVMLYSKCTGFSFKNSLTLLSGLSGRKLNATVLCFIHSNILAFSPTGRGADTSLVWNAQRDETVLLGEFERRAFDMSSRVFLSPNHTICSLDDDLMGTRATDNPLKTINHRKADREGHSADANSDALFRVVIQIRFLRRHEKRRQSVVKLLSSLLESRGEQCLQGLLVAADRGFAKQAILEELVSHGVSCIGIMDENYPGIHPLVGNSYLTAIRRDVSTDPRDQSEHANEVSVASVFKTPVVVCDRPRTFVIDDAPDLGPAVFTAHKSYKLPEKPRKEFHTVAIREYGSSQYRKITRVMHCRSSPLKDSLCYWNAVPYEHSFKAYLFNTRDDDGHVPKPSRDSEDHRDRLEFHLLEYTTVMKVGQRCADWFVLRQFRVTATEASRIYMCCDAVREALGYEKKNTPSVSDTDLLSRLRKSWFSTKRSTEAMTRGTVNEDAVLNCLKNKNYIAAIFP